MNEFRHQRAVLWMKQKKSFTLGHTKAKLLQKDFLVLSLFHAYYYYLCVIKKTFKLLSVLLFRVWKDEQPRNESVVYGFLWLQFGMRKFLDKLFQVFMLPKNSWRFIFFRVHSSAANWIDFSFKLSESWFI